MDSEVPLSPWFEHGPNLHTWEAPGQSVRWVFGLQWTATLGRRSRQWLFSQLRRQNVRWYACSGPQSELVGMDMTGRLVFEATPVYSAAVGYALSHTQGSHLLRLIITPERHWMVGVHHGSVLSHTDCWVSAPVGDQLQAALEQRFTDLVVQTVTWPADGDLAASPELGFLQESANDAARCRRLRFGVSREAVVLVAGGVVCAMGAGLMWASLGWWPFNHQASARLPKPESSAMVPAVYVHRMTDLTPLWQGLLQLPVDPHGWLLQAAECQLTIDNGVCSADYLRRRPTTDNDELTARAPVMWRLKPVSLDQSRLERQVQVATKRLEPQSEQARASEADDPWLLTLQRQSAMTPGLSVGPWRKRAQDGGDPSITIQSRDIRVRLPVRQLSRLQSWSLPVFWQSIRLEVMPNATVDQHNGYLMFHLKGELRALLSNAL